MNNTHKKYIKQLFHSTYTISTNATQMMVETTDYKLLISLLKEYNAS